MTTAKKNVIEKNGSKSNVEKRDWLLIDAAGKPLGRVAAKVASLLRGKHKTSFAPNLNCGDNVVIVNCDEVVLTGRKLEQKVKYHHTGWIGGIKSEKYSDLMVKNSPKIMRWAVEGMLPNNLLKSKMKRRLHVFAGGEHNLAAQKPQKFEI